MNKSLSIYLDILRFCAAVAVFVGHSQGFILPSIPGFAASHALEAVAIFFVLSGFVIQYVLLEKDKTWKSYVVARLSRIYSVVPVALLATFVVDKIGSHVNPGYYVTVPFYSEASFLSLAGALAFVNELWFAHGVFGSNEAYWSLGFEVPYYVLAGLLTFLPRRRALPAACVFALFLGPKIMLYSAIWFLGAATYRMVSSPRFSLPWPAGILLFLFSILLYVLIRFGLNDFKQGMYAWTGVERTLLSAVYFFCVGIAVAINIFAFSRIVRAIDLSMKSIESPIRWLAGATFTIYLTHEPLLIAFRALSNGVSPSPATGLAGMIAIFCLCMVLAELGERRKNLYRNWISRLLIHIQDIAGLGGRWKSPAP